MYGAMGCQCPSLVWWVGNDRFCLDRVDAERDSGCTGRGGTSDRGVPRGARDCTCHIGHTITLYTSLPARTAVMIFRAHYVDDEMSPSPNTGHDEIFDEENRRRFLK